jgi:hypothetical protein
MTIVQANALVFLMAYRAFLVEAVLFHQDTTLTSTEPSHVFSIKTV